MYPLSILKPFSLLVLFAALPILSCYCESIGNPDGFQCPRFFFSRKVTSPATKLTEPGKLVVNMLLQIDKPEAINLAFWDVFGPLKDKAIEELIAQKGKRGDKPKKGLFTGNLQFNWDDLESFQEASLLSSLEILDVSFTALADNPEYSILDWLVEKGLHKKLEVLRVDFISPDKLDRLLEFKELRRLEVKRKAYSLKDGLKLLETLHDLKNSEGVTGMPLYVELAPFHYKEEFLKDVQLNEIRKSFGEDQLSGKRKSLNFLPRLKMSPESVVDGDTFEIFINTDTNESNLGHLANASVRLLGVDTEEMKGDHPKIAEISAKLLAQIIQASDPGQSQLFVSGTGSRGRFLANYLVVFDQDYKNYKAGQQYGAVGIILKWYLIGRQRLNSDRLPPRSEEELKMVYENIKKFAPWMLE